MENLNKKTLSFSARLFTHAVAALALVTSVAACGNNGGDGNGGGVVGPQLGITGCSSCVTSMANPLSIDIFNAKNPSGIASLQGMQLIVNGANFVPGTSSSYNLYSGPVAIQGNFILSQTVADPATGQCVIPAGTYGIQTADVGQMSLGTLRVPRLVSTTGNIVLELSEGVLYKDVATQATRLFGTLMIKSVNGQVCTNAFSAVLN
ncbi:hypothetical protein [Bdellovibrio svalbardensis]|uniref:Secreted protein n=1 Tax=Bdellovibrio svalbardensis TaxID=2972972 RepID=A0ABT6DHG4_9BACT|nr:hypothetical protein [Bdellovibrio svalbardensis]MDG0816238.1 hypothetical protein [Bdellovibrio svalbardensis]